NVAMSATGTITSNPRVLGADPLVEHLPATGEAGTPEHRARQPGGFGEDGYVTLVQPNRRSPREGFHLRGGPPAGHAPWTLNGTAEHPSVFNPREAFGSHTEHDHLYNTPRAWFMQRTLNPISEDWDSGHPGASPHSDTLPWSRRPERLLTIEDVKDVLSSHYQGTVYDLYSTRGTEPERRAFRPIGLTRHNALAILQIRPDLPESYRSLQWVCFASNPFNTLIPMFTNVEEAP